MTFRPNLIITIIILFSTASACMQNSRSEEFTQAAQVYSESISLEMEVRSIFGSLEQVIARDSTLSAYDPELKRLLEEMTEWEKQVFRVGEGNDAEPLGHQHKAGEFSGAETLATQQKLNEQLNSISDRLIALMEKMSR